MSRAITAKSVEAFLLNTPKVCSVRDLMDAFLGHESRHEVRFGGVLAKLLSKGVVMWVEGDAQSTGEFGSNLAKRLGLPRVGEYYAHITQIPTILKGAFAKLEQGKKQEGALKKLREQLAAQPCPIDAVKDF